MKQKSTKWGFMIVFKSHQKGDFFSKRFYERIFFRVTKNENSSKIKPSSMTTPVVTASLLSELVTLLEIGRKQKGEKSIKVLIKSSYQMSQKKELLSENILLTEKKSFHGCRPTINDENANRNLL